MTIRSIISDWIKKHGVKYASGTVDIPVSKQEVVVPELIKELKGNGFSAEEVLPYIPSMVSPLAPGSIKALKKTRTFSAMPEEVIKVKLLQWCYAAAEKFTASFNEIYFLDDPDRLIDFKEVYQAMCKARRLEVPKAKKQEITDSDIEEHFKSIEIDPITITSKKIEKKESKLDTRDLNYDKIIIIDPNNLPKDYPEFMDVDPEALEFFGLSDVPKEKL